MACNANSVHARAPAPKCRRCPALKSLAPTCCCHPPKRAIDQTHKLAVSEINAKGGILGKQVELIVADDGSDADGAVKAFNFLIFQRNVVSDLQSAVGMGGGQAGCAPYRR